MRLTAENLTLGYGRSPVVSGLSFDVNGGEILVIVGPSGCGKTTLLRSLAGLLTPASGRLLADGAPIRGTSPDRALVFQDDALLPWRTVQRNVELPLAIRGVPRRERATAAARWLAQVGLAGQEARLPRELSGGMRQRVQLARTLAGAPRAILMDEPFGGLDAQTRSAMQELLITVWSARPATVVFVTHDVDEALLLGDRVGVLGQDGIAALIDVPHRRDPRARTEPAVGAAKNTILGLLGSRGAAPGGPVPDGAGTAGTAARRVSVTTGIG